MFLRTRLKDGKEHYYWSIVENRRCRDDRVVQQTVLYLGEINDIQREQWIRAVNGAYIECALTPNRLLCFLVQKGGELRAHAAYPASWIQILEDPAV